ncbi:MAG: prepilin-type N-terminal cleavage/methylation domain-containing protein [Verrucomicrobia bacterium]|nr:prepilin-type N-terminal cleavage/methylation domain-containing protein [Verrucomicrobiota bacterium]MBU1910011.1 prepilin-type N-terminal cleavage/methylation domain-containing protein [Verrucomicrobiota bacterium]
MSETVFRSKKRRSAERGFTLVELLVVLLILAGTVLTVTHQLHQRRLTRSCAEQLWHIYTALEMYEIDRGTLPRLAFFPNDPKQDADSLVTVIQPYAAVEGLTVCPAVPASQRALGLTYVWNVENNGRKLHPPGVPRWMLVEINALSESVPPPHQGRYHILYTDGQVELSKSPPPDLRRL